MIFVPVATGDIAVAMISAAQMIYASRMMGTDIISYRASDISSAEGCICFRNDDIQDYVLMIYTAPP